VFWYNAGIPHRGRNGPVTVGGLPQILRVLKAIHKGTTVAAKTKIIIDLILICNVIHQLKKKKVLGDTVNVEFPPKKKIGNNYDPEFLNGRLVALDTGTCQVTRMIYLHLFDSNATIV
jgi:hypothetical protein